MEASWRVENCDCREGLFAMSAETVQLFVTSPPYAQGMAYEQGLDWDGLHDLMGAVAALSIEACVPGGFFFVNFGETTKYPRTMAELYNGVFTDSGWIMHSRRVWAKPFFKCGLGGALISHTIPAAEWEFIWTFRKSPNDREIHRNKSLSLHGIWHTSGRPMGVSKDEHPAAFPSELAAQAIRVWSDPGDLVCDPFTGSGSTGIAAVELGRKFIGFEQDAGYTDLARRRIGGARIPLFCDEADALKATDVDLKLGEMTA